MGKMKNTIVTDDGYCFKLATSEVEKNEIYDSRYRIAKDLFPYLFKESKYGHLAKDDYDDASFLFYCKKESIIASCRASPLINGAWEVDDSLPEGINLDFDNDRTLQLNRVYIDENYRNENLHAYMFYYFGLWVLNNTQYDRYFAICNAGLVRMYKRIGAEILLKDGFKLKDHLSHNYYLVGGRIEDIIHTISNNSNFKISHNVTTNTRKKGAII